jgi:hypothetical protein
MYIIYLYIYIHTPYFRIFFQEGIFSIFPTCANPTGTRTSMFPIPHNSSGPSENHPGQATYRTGQQSPERPLTGDSQAFNVLTYSDPKIDAEKWETWKYKANIIDNILENTVLSL